MTDSDFLRFPVGGDGGGATGSRHKRATGHADSLRHLHHAPGGRAHAGPDDQHLHPAKYRDGV